MLKGLRYTKDFSLLLWRKMLKKLIHSGGKRAMGVHKMTNKFMLVVFFAIIITGCDAALEAPEPDHSKARITQVKQDITTDGFGEYTYKYTNEEPGTVQLWLEILEDGKSVDFENGEELMLLQEHNAHYNAELELNVKPDDNGTLVWQVRFGEVQTAFSTENYASDCITRNYSVSSEANLDGSYMAPIVKFACSKRQVGEKEEKPAFEFKFFIQAFHEETLSESRLLTEKQRE